jgi:hypothetical protein
VKPVEAHPEAEEEFHGAVDYYEDQVEGLGRRFREAIKEATARMSENPVTFPLYENTICREVLVHHFPFAVYYVDEPDRNWVIAFANQYRRPGYWLSRLRKRR